VVVYVFCGRDRIFKNYLDELRLQRFKVIAVNSGLQITIFLHEKFEHSAYSDPAL
jgi:hypothetical protein